MKRIPALLAIVLSLVSLAAAQRLPQTATPERYTLKLTPDMKAATFAGDETIDVRVLAPTKTITLNALEISFDEVTITAGGKAQKATVALEPQREMATLTVPAMLPVGPAQIKIRYRGILNDKLRGFYLSEAEGHRYAVTQFESTDARRAFPSFDEPAYKAVFDITVVAPASDMVISNSRIVSDNPVPGTSQHTVRFATSPKMSTYLVAVLVGEFQCIEGSADNIPIRVCTPPGKQEMGRFALTASENVLKFYDRYFGIKYPYGKLDHIAIPDFQAGAMENIGAITYRDADLLVDEKHAPTNTLKNIAEVVAHEMAHQWFGDLVTMQWWNDIWLNEGFATWMESKPVAAWKPEWHLEMDDQESAHQAMRTDWLQNTRPIRQQAESSAQITELFDEIAYNKTAAVLRMVESYIGPEVFREGINRYLQAHANANATAEDFWTTIATTSHKPVDRIMSTFVNNAGVPMVSADFKCGGASPSVTLRQQRFFIDRELLGTTKEVWTIPVCIASNGSNAQCELLTGAEQTFKVDHCDPMAFLNAGGRGYYRSEYDPQVISRVAPKIEQTLTPVERLAMLENEWALVRMGAHGIGDYLQLADGVRSDRAGAVLSSVDERLQYISDYLVSGEDRERYQAWVRALLRPVMEEIGWTAKPGDTDERRELRASVFDTLGYSGRDPEALKQATVLLKSYLQDQASVDPALVGPALTLSALQGTPALHDEFITRANTAKSPQTYRRYLSALASFNDPALLQRTLEYALSSKVRSQDAPMLMAHVMINPAGRDLAWQFVRAHWNELQTKSDGWGQSVMVQVSGSFCDATKKEEVQDFFREHPVAEAERGLKKALERIGDCMQLKNAQEPKLARWLEGQHTAVGQ